jgi:hypothetical protein
MSAVDPNRPRVAYVLHGFPQSLVPPSTLERLQRYWLDLDALGRIDEQTGEPLIDEITLTSMLREFVSPAIAGHLVEDLKKIQGCAFRVGLERDRLPAREVSWFELARSIVIFDAEPEARFDQLGLANNASTTQVIKSVQKRFPSLEEEMLDPRLLAPQLIARLQDREQAQRLLAVIARQLGWWSALITVLMLPPAVAALDDTEGQAEIAWPLAMNVLAAAVGGWTLTVVGSCVLAPAQ